MVALGAKAAVVRLDDVAADGQSQARAARPEASGPVLVEKKGSKIRRRSSGECQCRSIGHTQLGEPAGGVGCDSGAPYRPSGIAWRALISRLISTCWIWAAFTRANGRPVASLPASPCAAPCPCSISTTTSSTSRFRSIGRAMIGVAARPGKASIRR